MPETKPRPPYEILKETLLKLEFKHFTFDNAMALEPECLKMLTAFAREFHFYKWLGDGRNTLGKRLAFRRKYRRNPEMFPAPIQAELVSVTGLSVAAPGESLDRNAFFGYFKDLKEPSGGSFSDFFGVPIEPLLSYIEPVRIELKQIAEGLPENDPKRETIGQYLADIAVLVEVCKFVPKLFRYAVENRFPNLKTGHLIATAGGMLHFFTLIGKSLLESGLAGAKPGEGLPVFAIIDRLNDRLTKTLRAMTVDLIIPFVLALNLRIEWKKGELQYSRAVVIRRNFLSTLIDLFKGGRRKQKDKPAKTESPAPEEAPPKKEKQASKTPEDAAVDSRTFVEMHSTLEKFVSELRADLAPEKNERGEVTDYKSMFDQFEVPPAERDLTFTRFLLRGRLKGVDPTDYRYQDQTVVNSVHWLYDRILGILNHYRFSEAPVTRFDAESFIDAMRGLFFIGKNEMDETRRYGNFPQFRISMRRLFASESKQSKYNAMINSLSGLMDKTRDEMEKIWK